jgi:DNA-binding winged helix-turn-helix (wHTH) protein
MVQGRDRSISAVTEADLHFGPFRLEKNSRLWHGADLVALRPQALAVLRYVAERPGQLVTKEELLTHLWPGLYVTQTVLRVCVHAIWHALQDSPSAPRFIETVGRQGYRFVGAVSAPPSALSPQPQDARERSAYPAPVTQHTPLHTLHFVGREQELARLHTAFARTQRGERQVVFPRGRAGDWQDDTRGSLSGPGPGERAGVDRPRAVSGTPWSGGSVFTLAGGVGTVVSGSAWGARAGHPAPLCPAVVGADGGTAGGA